MPQPLTPLAGEIVSVIRQMYSASGFEPPWIGYLAFEEGTCVGTCSFKSAPRSNRVEIAYFTFPGNEGRGVATTMAAELVRIAQQARPGVVVTAQTLPEESPSTGVLRRLGFQLAGVVLHPEDGPVWEWQCTRAVPSRPA